ncbi:helix-turn-helix domain-containing protein [Rothia uropygialis]
MRWGHTTEDITERLGAARSTVYRAIHRPGTSHTGTT